MPKYNDATLRYMFEQNIIDGAIKQDPNIIVNEFLVNCNTNPTPIINSVLHIYDEKTILSSVENHQSDCVGAMIELHKLEAAKFPDVDSDDILTIIVQTGANHQQAAAALNKHDHNLVDALLELDP